MEELASQFGTYVIPTVQSKVLLYHVGLAEPNIATAKSTTASSKANLMYTVYSLK